MVAVAKMTTKAGKPLPMRESHVKAVIAGPLAVTTVQQTFENTESEVCARCGDCAVLWSGASHGRRVRWCGRDDSTFLFPPKRSPRNRAVRHVVARALCCTSAPQ